MSISFDLDINVMCDKCGCPDNFTIFDFDLDQHQLGMLDDVDAELVLNSWIIDSDGDYVCLNCQEEDDEDE